MSSPPPQDKKSFLFFRNRKHNLVNRSEEIHRQDEAKRLAEEQAARESLVGPNPEEHQEPPPQTYANATALTVKTKEIRVRLGRKRSRARSLWHRYESSLRGA
ncbi:MAG: hypothetical protein J0L97_00075 [Alphaproteobacteria bacterium]|nr:hypothetical protein [Alphaproteobacteria bacterium]